MGPDITQLYDDLDAHTALEDAHRDPRRDHVGLHEERGAHAG